MYKHTYTLTHIHRYVHTHTHAHTHTCFQYLHLHIETWQLSRIRMSPRRTCTTTVFGRGLFLWESHIWAREKRKSKRVSLRVRECGGEEKQSRGFKRESDKLRERKSKNNQYTEDFLDLYSWKDFVYPKKGFRISLTHSRSLLQNIVSFIGLFCKRDLGLFSKSHVSKRLQAKIYAGGQTKSKKAKEIEESVSDSLVSFAKEP